MNIAYLISKSVFSLCATFLICMALWGIGVSLKKFWVIVQDAYHNVHGARAHLIGVLLIMAVAGLLFSTYGLLLSQPDRVERLTAPQVEATVE